MFRDIDKDGVSHTTVLDSLFEPDYRSAVAFFTQTIARDLRLVGGRDVLYGKLKQFIETELFDRSVDLEDANTLRNLSESAATKTLLDAMKAGINQLTVSDRGTTEIRGSIKLSTRIRPHPVENQAFITPKRSFLNKIVGDSGLELDVAAFLDGCPDIVSFIKNPQAGGLRVEYQNQAGTIATYVPDFIVRRTEIETWVIETKGREDLDDQLKVERLSQWCADASGLMPTLTFRSIYIRQEDWEKYQVTSFAKLVETFAS